MADSRKIDCTLLLPESVDATQDGCPIRTKRRHIAVPKGVCGVVQWALRWPDGAEADFSDCVAADVAASASAAVDPESNSLDELAEELDVAVKVRFQGCDLGSVLAEVDGTIEDAEHGIIRFQIPAAVCQHAGIYKFSVGVFIGAAMAFGDTGLISVEPGAFGDTSQMGGPPTIQEIRMHLRDRPEENDLLGDYEFDDAEILDAITWPVRYFNEQPPDIVRYNCGNFPFRYNWRNAIVGELLRTAAHYYVRNKLNAVGAGTTIDEKNKNDDYLRIAKMYRDEFVKWVDAKKSAMNMDSFYGTVR